MEDVTTLVDFKRLNSYEDAGIPVLPENRRVTDKKGFLIYGLAILIFLPFLIYTLAKADPRRLTHHADDCGNLCGVNNSYLPGIFCSGQDFSEKIYYDTQDGCTESCGTDGATFDKKCYPDKEFAKGLMLISEEYDREVHNAIHECTTGWWKILFSAIITIALSVLTLVLLRYATGPLVWSLIIFVVMILIVFTGVCWYGFAVTKNDGSVFLVVSIIWSIVAFVIITVLLVLMKKIRLIIQLYKEAVKVLAAMPLLMIVPILTTLVQFVILIAFYVITFYLVSSLDLYQVETFSDEKKYRYMYSPITWFTIIFNFIITCWASRFFEGIQYMIISGSVGKWYFSRNKNHLDSPVLTSAKVTLKYHLGTVAFGSFLIMAFSLVKAFLKAIFRNVCCRCLVILYCSSVEIIIRFISENSYIQTALHGHTFYKSAKKATNLLMENAKSVIAVNCVGDFIVMIMILVVTMVSTAISYSLFMSSAYLTTAIPVVICLILNLIIVCITFATFQAVIDTLLMCFCEDTVLNDGISRPYFMSRGLMEFVENSKKIYTKLKN